MNQKIYLTGPTIQIIHEHGDRIEATADGSVQERVESILIERGYLAKGDPFNRKRLQNTFSHLSYAGEGKAVVSSGIRKGIPMIAYELLPGTWERWEEKVKEMKPPYPEIGYKDNRSNRVSNALVHKPEEPKPNEAVEEFRGLINTQAHRIHELEMVIAEMEPYLRRIDVYEYIMKGRM